MQAWKLWFLRKFGDLKLLKHQDPESDSKTVDAVALLESAMLPAVNARKLQHQSHFTWQSRYAPRCSGDELPPASWRERASKHRERCPVLQGHRPPRPPHVKYVPKELPTAEQVDLEPLDFLPAPPESLEDDADGDCFGVLSRVELSRYIARRSAILVRTQQSGQGASVESGSDRLEMSTESFCLKEVDIPWKVILDALSFERMQLRRGFSNQWPDALWSPACLNREAVTELECKLTKCIREIEELADAQDCVRSSLQAMPLGVLLRHLLCDARIAVGDLSCAAKALWGAVTPEAGADPLQPPLLIVWENCLNCNYLKAQQCLRFGRLAILAAAQSLVAAQAGGDQDVHRRTDMQTGLTRHSKHLLQFPGYFKPLLQVAKVEAYTEELRHRREARASDLQTIDSRDLSRLYID